MQTPNRVMLPIFPPPRTRVRVPALGGGNDVTWTMGEAHEVDGVIVIRCVGKGNVPAGKVKAIA